MHHPDRAAAIDEVGEWLWCEAQEYLAARFEGFALLEFVGSVAP